MAQTGPNWHNVCVYKGMKKIYVYIHKSVKEGKVYYVGIGTKRRAYSKAHRNRAWHFHYDKYGLAVEIINELTREDAIEVEKELIHAFGKKNTGAQLVNITDGGDGGFTGHNAGQFQKGVTSWNKGISHIGKKVMDKKTGIIYNSIRHAAREVGMPPRTLHNQLTGKSKNRTSLKLI